MNSARIAIGPLLIAVGVLIVHLATSHQYGFHRDELGFLEDSRFLDWGYVSYPPVTPLLARVASELFGASPAGMRMLPAIAQSVAVLLSGLIARELGGDRWAQTVAAAAVAIAPFAVLTGGLFLYVSFEYVIWVAIGYCVVRLLKSSDPRWWVPIGALVGLGLMTKYTVAVCAIGLGVGLLLTQARGIIRSPWLIAGILIAVVTITPNLIWQVQHTFVSLEFLQSIRERDVRIGRTQGFLPEQLYVGASVVTLPLWLGGLWFYLRSASGAPFRTLGWMYLVSFTVFLVSQGRSYYLAPAYPTLLAAGAVALEGLIAHRSRQFRRITTTGVGFTLVIGGLVSAGLMLPIAPINSPLWEISSKVHDNFTEQIGWDELVETVAAVYHAIPENDRAGTAVLAANYGEVGALNLYGATHGLPSPLSGVNTS